MESFLLSILGVNFCWTSVNTCEGTTIRAGNNLRLAQWLSCHCVFGSDAAVVEEGTPKVTDCALPSKISTVKLFVAGD